MKFSISKVSSTLSPSVFILADKIETFCLKKTLAISDNKPCLSEVSIVIDQAKAFSVSPAHLAISEDGSLRVKTVNGENVVSIVDVKLIRASGNMAYVSGLNDGDLMLTTGQAFVSEGEKITFEMQEDG